eukprot:3938684-Rhodomonas_salina.4
MALPTATPASAHTPEKPQSARNQLCLAQSLGFRTGLCRKIWPPNWLHDKRVTPSSAMSASGQRRSS